ncbi:tRNA/tmRNA/rRNA uracil-C5-methylase, TrmA/RlmC/RlmD family [Microbacterium sp. cf046]|uniref:class I SAM-dependent RNA methyltransferase n=1 Tax=Microbacterium sp. cf046 TaxID=1761803 RepID=UPI0008E3FF9F|nr:TRAM domain-containing protein [Microbacterium sp. cf046]SFR95567.1 tRNA/tmRNA/rRNA uracil-C5-methylase, TrmA/RlmC/RlmD family [Microbacterium sp. cf046]
MDDATGAAAAGDELELDITSVAHGGVFVGRHGAVDPETGRGGRVVFVPDAIPGERVRIRLTDVGKKSFWRGDVLEVLDASPHRRMHIWRQADVTVPPHLRPGGADFGHIELSHQRELKLDVLGDALHRFGGVEPPVAISGPAPTVTPDGRVVDEESADGGGWRTRLSLHVDADGYVGPFAARSHSVIAVEDHPLATPEVERAALALGHGRAGRIDLVQPSDGRVRVIPRPDAAKTGPREAREVVHELVGAREFRVDAGGFWQVHRLAAATLDGAVRAAIGDLARDGAALETDAWHLDLYGGVGLFAAAIADLGGTHVTSVESDARATEHAGENLAEWVGARAETARVDRFVSRLVSDATARDRDRLARGVTVLDPPRSGAGRQVVEAVAALHPSAVVYVACDPVALARDVATFRDAGYDLRAVAAFDLFPNSHHIEAVATFVC